MAKGANGSDSSQTAKALLLGDAAEADLKPELEIFADDVKCAHGAAVGDLDAESLFYLRARGIPEAEARGLLLHAFLEDAVAEIVDDDQRELVRTELLTALKGDRMTRRKTQNRRRFRCREGARRFRDPVARRSTASRWSISTAAPAPRSRAMVLDAMRDFASSEYANVHRGVHFLSAAATDRYEAARRTVQKFLNAAREDEIVFTKGGTEAINLVVLFLSGAADPAGRRDRADGDGASFQHRALAFPARTRTARCCNWVDVRDDGSLDIEALDAAITTEDQTGRRHPHVQCAGHRHAAEGDRRPRPCQGRAGAGRWLPGRGA